MPWPPTLAGSLSLLCIASSPPEPLRHRRPITVLCCAITAMPQHCVTSAIAVPSPCCTALSPPRHSVVSCLPASLRRCRRIRARGFAEATRLSFAINGATTALLHCHRPHMGMPPLLAALAHNACACASATSRQSLDKQPTPFLSFPLPPLLPVQPGRTTNSVWIGRVQSIQCAPNSVF